MVIRRLNRNSEPQATIECGKYTIQYVAFHLYAILSLSTDNPPFPYFITNLNPRVCSLDTELMIDTH